MWGYSYQGVGCVVGGVMVARGEADFLFGGCKIVPELVCWWWADLSMLWWGEAVARSSVEELAFTVVQEGAGWGRAVIIEYADPDKKESVCLETSITQCEGP